MQVWQPETLPKAAQMLDQPGTKAIAIGTALQLDRARVLAQPQTLIPLTGLLPKGISHEDDHWRVGAATMLDAIEKAYPT